MGRTPRLDAPGCRHHVMNRGARKQPTFAYDVDCDTFLELLGELPARFGLRVHGYALMPNHFHLLLESERGQLSEGMQFLQSQFTRLLNARYDWDGPVFKGRFRNRLVDDDRWWMHLLAYVHLNPVRAHLAASPDAARWTSHDAYVHPRLRPTWLTTEELLGAFGSAAALVAYELDVQIGALEAPDGFDASDLWAPSTSTVLPLPEPPAADGRQVSPDAATAEVVRVTGAQPEQLAEGMRGRGGNKARWLLIWWLAEAAHLRNSAIARRLGVPAAVVTRTLARVRQTRVQDEQLDAWMTELERPTAPATKKAMRRRNAQRPA